MTENRYLLRLQNFLFFPSRTKSEWGFVGIRFILAYLWLDTVIPRWTALAAGHPEVNGVARDIFSPVFGPGAGVPVTYVVTVFETLAAIALLLGFLTRVAALWGVFEFAITGARGWFLPAGPTHLTGSFGLLKDFGLMGLALTLFLNGSLVLSVDGYFARRRGAPAETPRETPSEAT
ncbi:MAG TPA: DoxX family protein [Thermoplasmata archaeon]|nr:DoxX family protein [Thermoplasmata archaeon]